MIASKHFQKKASEQWVQHDTLSYKVTVSVPLILFSFAASMFAAFNLGRMMSTYHNKQPWGRNIFPFERALEIRRQHTTLWDIPARPRDATASETRIQGSSAPRIHHFYRESAFYEALVHPALFVHPNPETVCIIGTRDCSVVREVMKHNTIEEVVLVGSTDSGANGTNGSGLSCFDDPRVEIEDEDTLHWIAQQQHGETDMRFDVIIIDIDEQEASQQLTQTLSSSESLTLALYNSLEEGGVLVSRSWNSPNKNYEENLVSAGFEALQEYEETHGIPKAQQNFLVAFKSLETRSRWFANEAEVAFAIHSRTTNNRTSDGPQQFRHFDAPAMLSYRYPSKATEIEFCSKNPDEFGCRKENLLDPERMNIPSTSFVVKPSTIEHAGRGVFAKIAVAKGSYIAAEECVHSIYIPHSAGELNSIFLEDEYEEPGWETLSVYADGYGFPTNFFGESAADVDASLITYVNHGCNGTYNVGSFDLADEQTATEIVWPEESLNRPYNPAVARNIRTIGCVSDIALKNIYAGEELLQNYLSFVSNSVEEWEKELQDLRAQCSRRSLGAISSYEIDSYGGSKSNQVLYADFAPFLNNTSGSVGASVRC